MDRYQILKVISQKQGRNICLVYDLYTLTNKILAIIPEKDLDGTIENLRRLIMHNSPYIVQIYDVFSRNGKVFILEEFVHGNSLGDLIRMNRDIKEKDKLKWRRELEKGLFYLHHMRPLPLYHGDIQPDNIIIKSDNQAKLIDFSSIKSNYIRNPAKIHATREFLDPRILKGTPYDREADFFSLNKTMNACTINQ